MSYPLARTSTCWTAAVSAWSIAALLSPAVRAAGAPQALPAGPLARAIAADLPPAWFETWPGLGLALVLLAAAILGVVKLRERQFRQRQSHLENLLDTRTEELAAANAKLEALAATDLLTGIPDRRAFDRALAVELRRASRGQGEIALLLVDVDHFKAYNDTYGQRAGDDCLRGVARTLAASVGRAGDLVARFGGEEFAVLLPNTDRRGAATVAERARRAIEALGFPHEGSECSPSVTVSVGAASLVALRGCGAEVLIGCADQALSRAKTAGGNRSSTYQLEEAVPALRLVG